MSGQLQMSPIAPSIGSPETALRAPAPVLSSLVVILTRPVPDVAIARASVHVLDWLACAVAARHLPPAEGFAALSADGGAGVCHSLLGAATDWHHALLLNAALGNMLEMDDLHRTSILHPGPVIVPAAIAVAEKTNATGADLLAAIVRGYEATIRVGRALGTSHYRYFHNTSTCGSFGAAAAAASLLGLDERQTVWALANAGSRTGGLWQMRHEPCETKSLHNVGAAQTGVQAALLAARGVRGPSTLLEGPQGLFAALSDGANAAAVLDSPDPNWAISDVSFKPWPACRHAHQTIDATLALREAVLASAQGNLDAVAELNVSTNASAIDFCNKPNPTTELEAKFSLQHCVAVVLCHGLPRLQHFAVDALSEPRVRALRARVSVAENAAMTAAFPRHFSAAVRIVMKSGEVYEHVQRDAWGDPELPMSASDIQEKARTLLAFGGVRNEDEVAKTLESTLALSKQTSVRIWAEAWPKVPAAGRTPA